MHDAALSGLVTEKKHQIEERGILREERTEEVSCVPVYVVDRHTLFCSLVNKIIF